MMRSCLWPQAYGNSVEGKARCGGREKKKAAYWQGIPLVICLFATVPFFVLRPLPVVAATQTITTVAGTVDFGYNGDARPATSARLQYPWGIALDTAGNLFIADTWNHRIRQVIMRTGRITTVAGTGAFGFAGDGGMASSASLYSPAGIALDTVGNLFIADTGNHRIRHVDVVTGRITTVAGTGAFGFSGDGGFATAALLAIPRGMALDAAGNLLIADTGNHRIRHVDAVTGRIMTVAGTGTAGFNGDGGLATSSNLYSPAGVALDAAGNLYIADTGNHRIRRVDAVTGVITTVAGTGASGFIDNGALATNAGLYYPYGIALDAAGNLFVSNFWDNRIYMVDANSGTITSVAGDGTTGYSGDGGPASEAGLHSPTGVALDAAGNLFIADTSNHRIRRVQMAKRPPLAAAGVNQRVNENELVMLDGSASNDPDDDPLTYHWEQLGGPPVALDLQNPLQPTFIAPAVPMGNATLTFQLIVSDEEATSQPDTVDITIAPMDHAPVVDAGRDQTVQEGSLVMLDGLASYDEDNDMLTYRWLQTAGPLVDLNDLGSARPIFTAPQTGVPETTLTFELTGSDGLSSAIDTVDVIIVDVNQPPVADAGANATVGDGRLVQLDGTASDDPEKDFLTYTWIQRSGPLVALSDATGPTPTFRAPIVGPSFPIIRLGRVMLVFDLVVSDGLTESTPDTVTITILGSGDPPACDLAQAQPDILWPPTHGLVPIEIRGVTAPNDNTVLLTIDSITQDESVAGLDNGDTSPDAVLQEQLLLLRAERAEQGNGRVYEILFSAETSLGHRCTGRVTVCVPHAPLLADCTDDGQIFDAMQQQ